MKLLSAGIVLIVAVQLSAAADSPSANAVLGSSASVSAFRSADFPEWFIKFILAGGAGFPGGTFVNAAAAAAAAAAYAAAHLPEWYLYFVLSGGVGFPGPIFPGQGGAGGNIPGAGGYPGYPSYPYPGQYPGYPSPGYPSPGFPSPSYQYPAKTSSNGLLSLLIGQSGSIGNGNLPWTINAFNGISSRFGEDVPEATVPADAQAAESDAPPATAPVADDNQIAAGTEPAQPQLYGSDDSEDIAAAARSASVSEGSLRSQKPCGNVFVYQPQKSVVQPPPATVSVNVPAISVKHSPLCIVQQAPRVYPCNHHNHREYLEQQQQQQFDPDSWRQ